MIALELVCGALALSTALLLVAVLMLTFRVHQWRERYNELIAKPFEFWRNREIARSLIESRFLPEQFDMRPSAEVIELFLPPSQPPTA